MLSLKPSRCPSTTCCPVHTSTCSRWASIHCAICLQVICQPRVAPTRDSAPPRAAGVAAGAPGAWHRVLGSGARSDRRTAPGLGQRRSHGRLERRHRPGGLPRTTAASSATCRACRLSRCCFVTWRGEASLASRALLIRFALLMPGTAGASGTRGASVGAGTCCQSPGDFLGGRRGRTAGTRGAPLSAVAPHRPSRPQSYAHTRSGRCLDPLLGRKRLKPNSCGAPPPTRRHPS